MNKRALYVEDDADTRDLVMTWLGMHGYQVIVARSISEGLDLARANKVNIYILDNWLKDGDGTDLCRQIRAFDLHTPILFLSGAAYSYDIEQAIAAGAQEYLTKPVDLDELYHTVERLIKSINADTSQLSLKY